MRQPSKTADTVESGGSSVITMPEAISRRDVSIMVGMLLFTTLLIVIR